MGGVESYDQNEFLVAIFSFGWLGVYLFFSISGFVIYMSILRCENFFMFFVARYLRLAPAMLVSSILIYLTSFLIPERPLGHPNLIDFLPSFTFIDPFLLSEITGSEVRSLDGAFWSLYIEVKFYFLVAVAYFVLGDKGLKSLMILYVSWLFLAALNYIDFENSVLQFLFEALNYAGVKYYGWFLMGVFAYKFSIDRSISRLTILFGLLFVASVTARFGDVWATLAACFTALVFILPIRFKQMRAFFASRIFLFFGYVSYPLYLIHQNIVTGLSIKLHGLLPSLPSYLYPLPFILLVVFISFCLAKFEPRLRKEIQVYVPKAILGYKILKD